MIINRQNVAGLYTGFRTTFNAAFSAAESQWDQVGMLVPSSTAQEVYAWLGALPRFREWVGERVIQNLASHDYTIKNRDFELTIGVDRNAIEDDTYGVYKPAVQMMGSESKTHPDELVFALLAAGLGTIGYDGQYFFDTDHPVLDKDGVEQSVSNYGGGAGTPWFLLDASKPVKPIIFQKRRDYQFVSMDRVEDEGVFMRREFRYGVDARVNAGLALWQLGYASKQDLTAANYGTARAAMMGMKGDGGKPLNVRPSLLVVPPSLEGKALDVIQAERLANGATNTYRNTAKLLVSPWLA